MSHVPLSNSTDGTHTETLEQTDSSKPAEGAQSTPTLVLRLEQPRDERRVVFHDGVIDNEHMNRMKSKCCCIYRKPVAFGESSSEDDEECEHCFGHPEKRKRNRKPPNSEEPSTSAEASSELDGERGDSAKPTVEEVPSLPDFEKTVKPSL